MKSLLVSLIVLTTAIGPAFADTFRSIPVKDLSFEAKDDALAQALDHSISAWSGDHVEVRLPVEAYLLAGFDEDNPQIAQGDALVVYRESEKEALQGVIDLEPGSDETSVTSFRFKIDREKTAESTEADFLKARQAWASKRAGRHLPGTAWFRHLAGKPDEENRRFIFSTQLHDSFEIFGGGRAISENLALDRDLILGLDPDKKDERVPLADITGVTVAAIDWSARLPKEDIALDPLARFIPEDQHAIFAPALPGFLDLLDRLDRESEPLAQSVTVRNPYRGLIDRYRRQLGLDLPTVATRLLPIKSIALTGGDPYFATGTDLAFLFETEKPDALFKALSVAIQGRTGIEPTDGGKDGLQHLAFTRAEGGISSHLIKIGELVAVTNSTAQISRLTAVVEGASKALGSTDEFRFFRHRYPMGGAESAFVFLSDATIRRWAGPETRIGASRRNRALAALNELTARGISGESGGESYAPLLGRVRMIDGLAVSEHFGSSAFLTPISELGIDDASIAEKDAYLQWRRGYESGWAQVFDPIAIRLEATDKEYDLDVTVLPLTVESDYREIISFIGDSELTAVARARHAGSLVHLATAVDSSGEAFKGLDQELTSMLPGLKINPLSWVGESISIDLGRSLFWEATENMMDMEQLTLIPATVRIEVKNKLNLGLFLTAVRGMIESSAPDTVAWETKKHGERSYVVITEKEEGDFESGMRICYAIMPNALLLALDERVLQKAMDRELNPLTEEQMEGLPKGRSMLLDIDPQALALTVPIFDGGDDGSRRAMQSWGAIPILNEWHRRFPERDPVEVHEAYFGTRIACPGEKGYRWNLEALTMESIAYGHPSSPREDGKPLAIIERFGRLTSGIDFEDGGLRVRLHAGPEESLVDVPQPEPGKVLAKADELVLLKPGRSLHYRGHDADGEHTWSYEIVSIEKSETGTRFVTKEPWSGAGESGVFAGTYEMTDEIKLLSWKDSDVSVTYSEPEVDTPGELREGVTYHSRSRAEQRYEEEGELDIEAYVARTEFRVLGLETIEVPAGKFEDCIKVEYHQESVSGDYFDRTTSWFWYHPGTGLIRSEDLAGVSPTMELVRVEEGKQ